MQMQQTHRIPRNMSGLDALKAIRQLRPGVKSILLSGYTESSMVQPDPDSRPTAFMQKPFDPAHLADQINRVLAQGTDSP